MESPFAQPQGADAVEERFQILGGESQTLQVVLQPSEEVVADAGNFCYGSDNLVFEHPGADLASWLQAVSGGPAPVRSVFYNAHESRTAFVGLSNPQGGEILKLTIQPTMAVYVLKGCFLCARDNVGVQQKALPLDQPLYFDSPTSWYYCAGDGDVFIQTGGVILQKRLRAGESLYFDPSCIAACDATCRLKLGSPGTVMATVFGLKRTIVKVQGPGNVYFSTQSIQRTARSVTTSLASYGSSAMATRAFLLMLTLALIAALATTRIVVELEQDDQE